MPSLFNEADMVSVIHRIEKLNPESKRLWGKMNVGQMLAHCNISMETAMGKNVIKPLFIGKLIGPLFKKTALGDKPFGKGAPSDKTYIFKDERNFEVEKNKTINSIKEFFAAGHDGCTKHPHPFFGKFTPEQWGIFQWKHLDHHLRQFGV